MKPFRRHWIAIVIAVLGLALGVALGIAAAQQPQAPVVPPKPPNEQEHQAPPPPNEQQQMQQLPPAAATPQPAAPGAYTWNYPPCPYAQSPTYPDMPGVCHPYPQPFPQASTQTTTGCPGKDCKTEIKTGEGIFPPMNPFNYQTFPGNNFLPSIYTNVFDTQGHEIPNTLPSTPTIPYNLHDGDPIVSVINPISPEDDLKAIYYEVMRHLPLEVAKKAKAGVETRIEPEQRQEYDAAAVRAALQRAVDIFEGNPVPGRIYSGFPLLHYDSLEKVRKVIPIKDEQGNVIGGNVDVHQIWYNQRIESDTAYIDLSLLKPPNVPAGVDPTWTITYTVDVLSRGRDDFSPYAMYIDPPTNGMPGVGMDQSFFDMEDGTRTVFRIKMAPVSYFSLVYTWGWRMHPPRAQVMENAGKAINYKGNVPVSCPADYQGKTLPQLEQAVFCMPDNPNCTSARCGPDEPRFTKDGKPTPCEQQKLYAISQLGDLAPEKKMWNAVRDAQKAADQSNWEEVRRILDERVLPAFIDWVNRNLLPKEVKDWVAKNVPDYKSSDVMLLYVNNSTYGELTNGAWGRWDSWEERPKKLRVLVLNADHFVHSYTIADFGGNRGWENQFRSTVKVAGSGCWFTFGRNWFWMPVGGPLNPYICVAETGGPDGLTPAVHWMDVELNYDPSRRLRFYQFDPFHHDVAIYSVH
jgi:hypothetical protein